MDLQVDDFYHDSASALLALFRVFPRRQTLYIEDLIGFEPTDEFGLPSTRHQACLSALLWLSDEGYIRHQDQLGYSAVEHACLTQKSFVRLVRLYQPDEATWQNLPASVRRGQGSLAEQLRQALHNNDGERLAILCQWLFQPINASSDIA